MRLVIHNAGGLANAACAAWVRRWERGPSDLFGSTHCRICSRVLKSNSRQTTRQTSSLVVHFCHQLRKEHSHLHVCVYHTANEMKFCKQEEHLIKISTYTWKYYTNNFYFHIRTSGSKKTKKPHIWPEQTKRAQKLIQGTKPTKGYA